MGDRCHTPLYKLAIDYQRLPCCLLTNCSLRPAPRAALTVLPNCCQRSRAFKNSNGRQHTYIGLTRAQRQFPTSQKHWRCRGSRRAGLAKMPDPFVRQQSALASRYKAAYGNTPSRLQGFGLTDRSRRPCEIRLKSVLRCPRRRRLTQARASVGPTACSALMSDARLTPARVATIASKRRRYQSARARSGLLAGRFLREPSVSAETPCCGTSTLIQV